MSHQILLRFLMVATIAMAAHALQAQTPSAVYDAIKDDPSKMRWCLPAAGNDPAGIIGHACEVYSRCLASADLSETNDQLPYPQLSADMSNAFRKCHQALYNGARTNPQLKGSKATQDWLTGNVMPGTEAKTFTVPVNWKYR